VPAIAFYYFFLLALSVFLSIEFIQVWTFLGVDGFNIEIQSIRPPVAYKKLGIKKN